MMFILLFIFFAIIGVICLTTSYILNNFNGPFFTLGAILVASSIISAIFHATIFDDLQCVLNESYEINKDRKGASNRKFDGASIT